MHILVDYNSVSLRWQTGVHRTDIMFAVVVHGIVGGNESRHIATRLSWQVGIDGPVVLILLRDGIALGASQCSAMAADSLVDILRTAVVGRNHEVPITEDTIEVAQQTGSGKRRLHGVAALINERVDLQSILFSGSRHKLPETSSTHARHSLRIEGRLDNGQIFQLQRHLIGLECLFEDRYVEVKRTKHVTHRVAQPSAVTVDKPLHNVIVCHLHHGWQALQSLYVDLLGIGGILVLHLAVARCAEISLRHIKIEQTVQVVGHGLGEINQFLVALLISDRQLVLNGDGEVR